MPPRATLPASDVLGAPVTIHSDFVRCSASGRALLAVGGESPDLRFCSPTGDACVAWALGSILHKLITGRAPVPCECTPHERVQLVASCIGTPDLGEYAQLGIGAGFHKKAAPVRVRRKVKGATPCEARVLRATLTWVPTGAALCTRSGLRLVVRPIAE